MSDASEDKKVKTVKNKQEHKADEEDNLEKDQKEMGYYYDDAHGYEIYQPDLEEGEPKNADD